MLRVLLLNWKSQIIYILFYISFLGVILRVFVCILQSDQKAIIAYSSVGHITILLTIASRKTVSSAKTFVLLMFIHGLCSSILFFSSYKFFTISSNRLIQLNQGFLFKFPLLFAFFIFFIFINFRVPPIPTFFVEIFIFSSVLLFKKLSVLLIILLIFFSCYYSIFLLVNSFHGKINIEKFYSVTSHDLFLFLPYIVFSCLALIFFSSIF